MFLLYFLQNTSTLSCQGETITFIFEGFSVKLNFILIIPFCAFKDTTPCSDVASFCDDINSRYQLKEKIIIKYLICQGNTTTQVYQFEHVINKFYSNPLKYVKEISGKI